jgi:formylmethanofuran dehydrogenase subunit E
MYIFGLDKIDLTDPSGKDHNSLIVFVEIDRCATDAIQSVTGCKIITT